MQKRPARRYQHLTGHREPNTYKISLCLHYTGGRGGMQADIQKNLHSMEENEKEVSLMENKERDIFAEALVFLKSRHLAKYGVVAEGLRAVRIEEPEDKEKERT